MKFKSAVAVLFFAAFSAALPQVSFNSSNLPIVVIDTQGKTIVDEPKIMARMGIINNGGTNRNFVTDNFNDYNGWIGIEIRGQSSQQFPKKQYALETRDSTGDNLDVSLLGMPKENDWILSAPYSDKSLMRNVLEYNLSNEIGRYASRTQFCELVLNGEYMGLYVLMEKIKRNKNRVNIKKLESADNAGDDLTGGYIIKIDKMEGSQTQGWYSAFTPEYNGIKKIYFQYHYPDQDDITPVQKNYIQQYVGKFEAVTSTLSYNDPFWGYLEYVDINSFVDFYLLNEISKNVDAYRLSTYLYKNRDSEGGKLCLGPVWDFNLAFGNCDYDNASAVEGWEVNYRNDSDWLAPFWAKKIFDDPVFANMFAIRWNELRETVFKYENIEKFIDDNAAYISEAAGRNFLRWPVIGIYVWPNYYIGNSFPDEISYLKNWIKKRIEWIDSNVHKTFSEIDWLNPDLSYLTVSGSKSTTVPSSLFYQNILNVDSLVFKSAGDSLEITGTADSLKLRARYGGKIQFRGIAFKNGKIISLSPKYEIASEITAVTQEDLQIDFALLQNYPNPFNPSTKIKFSVPSVETRRGLPTGQAGVSLQQVSMKVYDILGREVSTLVNKELPHGNYSVEFNGAGYPSGIYFVILKTGIHTAIKKMVLLK